MIHDLPKIPASFEKDKSQPNLLTTKKFNFGNRSLYKSKNESLDPDSLVTLEKDTWMNNRVSKEFSRMVWQDVKE